MRRSTEPRDRLPRAFVTRTHRAIRLLPQMTSSRCGDRDSVSNRHLTNGYRTTFWTGMDGLRCRNTSGTFSQYPEFTISPTEEEAEPVRGGENWVRAATNPSAFVRPLRICFHQTVLAEIGCILYDEMRAITPAPQATLVNHAKSLWFFSLCADTFEFLFLQFLTRRERGELLKKRSN